MEPNIETKIVNLTPHPVRFMINGKNLVIYSSGKARCNLNIEHVGMINDFIPVRHKTSIRVVGLHPPKPNTIYIVSYLLASHVPERNDLYIVDDLVEQQGVTVGCRGLSQYTE